MNGKSREKECPLCGSEEREIVFRQHFEPLGNASLMDGYDVAWCQGCGFVFAGGIPPSEEFSRYYADASKYEFSHSGGQQHAGEVKRLESLAEWIAAHCATSARLIDIGCSTGELLVLLRARGFTSLVGLDPSEACVRHGTQQHGLRLIRGVLATRPEESPLFDVLVLSAVLEHMPDLDRCVEQMRSWIEPGGLVVIEVPDAEMFDQGTNSPYQEFSVEHINFFSAASLANLMRKHGLSAVSERHYVCSVGSGMTGAGLTMMFRAGADSEPPKKESASVAGVRRYLQKCEVWCEYENKVIQELVESREAILVWGTGTLCQRLLATTPFCDANIVAFIDSNPHYQGRELHGRPILAPADVKRYGEPILIASWAFEDEIRDQIRNALGLGNRLISLIPIDAAAGAGL